MTDGTSWTPVDDVSPPEDVRNMHDVDLVPDLTHPVRGRILRRLRQPKTVAELAAAMDVPITRLYHHVNRLEQLEMVHVVATRRVGAVTERRYQVTALSWKIAEEALDTLDPAELSQALGSLFDVAKLGLQRWIEAGGLTREAAEQQQFAQSLSELRLTPERQQELAVRLNQLAEEYTAESGDPDDPALVKTTLFVASFPEA